MGGVAAKHDGVVFQHRSEYMRWTLGDVRAAVERWHALSKRHGSSVSGCGVFQKFGVNKREFWEIFTDYSMLRDGAFLCLPVRHASTPRACALHARCHMAGPRRLPLVPSRRERDTHATAMARDPRGGSG